MFQHSSTTDSEHTDSLRHHRLPEPSNLAIQVSGNTAQRWHDIGICIRPGNRCLEQESLWAILSASWGLYRSRRSLLRTASSDSGTEGYQWAFRSRQYSARNLHKLGHLSWLLQRLPKQRNRLGWSYDRHCFFTA